MKIRSFFSSKNIELLPVLIPIILSFSSWTLYKVIHKDQNIVKIVKRSNQYSNPFKINCDFLKPVKNDDKIDRESDVSYDALVKAAGVKDSSALNIPLQNKGIFENLSNIQAAKNPSLSNVFNTKLINSGYIGEIGNLDPQKLDTNASDNIFNVQLSKINKNSSYTLTYDVDGYSNINSVTRSINGSFAIGGYLKNKKSGWTEVSERIDPELLTIGNNYILFNAQNKGEYYTIKNVRITENKKTDLNYYHIISKIYRDNVLYIRGFVNSKSSIESVEIGNNKIKLHGNEFEYLSLTENNLPTLNIKFRNKDNFFEEELIKDNSQMQTDKIDFYNESSNNILYKNESGFVLGLRNIDLPPVDQSISNVSKEYYGFRFKNNKLKETTINLPYDESKLPNGYTEKDISTFTFDYTQKKWLPVEIDSVNIKRKYIVFRTLGGNETDYINGVIKQPESPETTAFTPTTLNDVPVANPASKINLISPPTANQQGSAVVQYPIEIPKGTSGLQPSVAITYNSDNKSGWAGTGWDIPVETIELDTRWGVPAFDPQKESEIYTMGGEQLVYNDNYLPNKVQIQQNRNSGSTRFYFRTGITEGTYITRKGDTPASYTWESLDHNGVKKEYTQVLTDEASSNASGNIIRWYLTRVTDRYNNSIVYNYIDSFEGGGKGKYLSSITYSNNTVVRFENEAGVRQDRSFSYKLGVKLTDAKILNKISVFRANIKIREYELLNTYVGQFNKRLLSEVIQKDGSGNEFNRHKFTYDKVRIFPDQPKTYNTGDDIGNVGNFNGAGASAISGDFSNNINKIRGSVNFGSGAGCFFISFNKKNTFGINGSYSENKTYGKSQLIDIDGDGLPDKTFITGSGALWYRKNHVSNFGGVYNAVNWPAGNQLSKTSSYVGSAGVEFVYKNYAAGVNINWTNNNTPVYLSDVNGDGLLDLVSYGDVYFNRIRNGSPEFEPQHQDGPNVTETTPNIIFSGVPAVQIIEPGETGPQLLGNIVRMWEAPIDGRIRVTTHAQLEQNSVDGVDVWMELGSMTKDFEDDPSYVPSNSTMIGSQVTLTNPGQPATLSEDVNVKKGQRIFVVASAKENALKDRMVSNTEISYYTANPTIIQKDANDNYYYGFNSSYSYLASSKKGNPIAERGTVKINWSNLPNVDFTDDVDFKIYKIVVSKTDTAGTIQPSTSNLIYHHRLKKGFMLPTVTPTSNLISGVDLNNISVNPIVSDSTITFFNFDVSADTNVRWEKIKWKPQLEITTPLEVININALVQYNPYGERLTDNLPKDFRQYVPIGTLSSCRYYLYPKYGSSINDIITLNLPQLHTAKVTFSLKLKGNLGNVYTFKNTVDVVNNVMPMPRLDYCAIASQLYSDFQINDAILYDMQHYFEISSLDYDVAKYLAKINPDIYNSNFEPPFQGPPNVPASTSHKADHFAYRAGNTHYNTNTGLVYQGWGGFSYNGSKYKNETLKEKEFNSSLSAFNVNMQNPSLPCSGDPTSQAYQDCVIDYITQMMNLRYFTPIDLKADAETYSSPLESAELSQFHMLPAILGSFTEPDAESQYPGFAVPNPRGIIKYSKGSGVNMYGSAFIVGGNAGFSKDYSKDHFLDLNGDRYPDVVSSYSMQKTNLLGQLGNPGNTFERQFYNTTINYGASLSVPVPTKFSNTSNGGFYNNGEKNTHTTTSANAVGIGVNVQVGQARSNSKAIWFDINGDGLLDYLVDGTLYINNGKSFVNEANNWNMTDPSNNNSSSVSGGGGFSWPNGSFSFGVGLSKSKSTTNTAFLDLNGDGMEDRIVKSGNTYDMLVNTGTTFQTNPLTQNVELQNKQNSAGFNLYGTICFCFGVKMCFGAGYNKDKSVSKQTVDLRDFDGDGLPDLLISEDENTLKVYHNQLGKANLLSKITNPLKGEIDLSYDIYNVKDNYGTLIGGTYQMPFSKMSLTKVTISDYASKNTIVPGAGARIIPKGQVTFEYRKGVHDRREREFLGFGEVTTKTYGGLEEQGFVLHQSHVKEYETNYTSNDFYVNYNDTKVRQYFYKKGILRSSTLYDGNGKERSKTKYTYRYFDQLSSIGYQLSEGQTEPQYKDIGRIIPLLYKTENTITEYTPTNTSHSKTTISTINEYDKFGNVTNYTDRGTTLSNTADDINVAITYHAPNGKNVIGVPSSHVVSAGSLMRQTTTSIDSNYHTNQIRKLTDNGEEAVFDMLYDAWGNLQEVTQPLSANNQRYQIAYAYDYIYHIYLIGSQDSYNLMSSTTYDPNYLFGVPVDITDSNGVTATYSYDSFGRATQYKSPVDNDWTMKFYYYPTDVIPTAITERKAPIVNNVTPSVNYFSSVFTNAFGEELAAKKLFKEDGGKFFFANNVFQLKDNLGRPVKTVLRDKVTEVSGQANVIPELRRYDDYLNAEDQAVQIYTTTTYDPMDRPLIFKQHNVQTNNGTENVEVKNIYGFGPDRDGITQFTNTTISHLGNTSVVYTDERGRTTAAKQTDGTQNLWVSNKYDLLSQLIEVKHPNNNITTYSYDMLGRKIAMVHPDAGNLSYQYDLSGKLISSTNSLLTAASQNIVYTYDYNRLININIGGIDTATYTYGGVGATDFSAGRLTSQLDRTGFQTFKYTALGQVKDNTRIIVAPKNQAKLFKTSFVYDVYNRVNKITYPDLEEVYYNYNSAGLLDNIQSKEAVSPQLRPIVEKIEYNNRDQMISYKAGNDTENIYNYDSWGKLAELSLIYSNTGNEIRKNEYTFDGNGNIVNVQGTTPLSGNYPANGMTVASSKIYSYDGFNRLGSSTTIAKGKEQTRYYKLDMTYNDIGNIEIKDYGLKFYNNNGTCQNPSNSGVKGTYFYEDTNHPNAVSKIEYIRGDFYTSPLDCGGGNSYPTTNAELFSYDLNGNMLSETMVINGVQIPRKKYFWSKTNELNALADNGMLSHYVYDANGERVLKSDGVSKKMYVDGNDPNKSTQMGSYTYYPNGYAVLNDRTLSKHYYINDQKIATKVSNIPSHRFKTDNNHYNYLGDALVDEIVNYANLSAYPPPVWVANNDSQGTYNSPVNTISNEADCAYVIEQQLISLSQDPLKEECYKFLLNKYTEVLNNGQSFCSMWDSFINDYLHRCLDGQMPPEINDSEIYWIHPDHLGSSSVLTNSNGDISNWYEYMPFGEPLMELTTGQYNNPYKYNGKETDSQTGLHYYGARYYDSNRSFWLSVDPLAEQTMEPYIYCGNNPINYIDPDGNFRLPANATREQRRLYNEAIKTIKAVFRDSGFRETFKDRFKVDDKMIQKMLRDGDGPTVIMNERIGHLGLFDQNKDPNAIYIDPGVIKTVSKHKGDRKYIDNLAEIIIHEGGHWGDYQMDGKSQEHDGIFKMSAQSKSGFPDAGDNWEIIYFGTDTQSAASDRDIITEKFDGIRRNNAAKDFRQQREIRDLKSQKMPSILDNYKKPKDNLRVRTRERGCY